MKFSIYLIAIVLAALSYCEEMQYYAQWHHESPIALVGISVATLLIFITTLAEMWNYYND